MEDGHPYSQAPVAGGELPEHLRGSDAAVPEPLIIGDSDQRPKGHVPDDGGFVPRDYGTGGCPSSPSPEETPSPREVTGGTWGFQQFDTYGAIFTDGQLSPCFFLKNLYDL